jgi:hypothetical protein
LWFIALVAVGMLLVELCLALDHNRAAVQQAQARLEYLHAQIDRRTTRAELAPQASLLGLVPVDAKQVVQLPPEYLAAADPRTGQDSRPVLAWAEGVSRVLVPEATARGRDRTNGRTDEP